MFQLIATLLAIALMSVSLLAAVNYVNPVAQQALALSRRLESDFDTLRQADQAYANATGAQPNTLSDFTPHYAFVPAAVGQTAWSFGAGGTGGIGRYVCLSGAFGPATTSAVLKLRQIFSPQAYFIAAACGATTNAVPATPTFTGAVTLWVAPYQ